MTPEEERLINEIVEERLRRDKEISGQYPIEAVSFATPRVPIDEITRKANERYMEILGARALLSVPVEIRERLFLETLRKIRDLLANE